MARHVARIGSLTIPAGQTASPGLSTLQFSKVGVGTAAGLLISGPSTLPESVVVQILPSGSAVWRTLQSGGADVAVGAGKAVVISPTPFFDLRLLASAAVAADRTFDIDVQIDASV